MSVLSGTDGCCLAEQKAAAGKARNFEIDAPVRRWSHHRNRMNAMPNSHVTPEKVSEVLGRLETLASQIHVPYPHWLCGDDVEQGLSYCQECATKRVQAGEAESVDGGFWPDDSDTCNHCEDCGRLLAYSLTDEGVDAELSHFTNDRLCGRMTPERAYHLARVLEKHLHHPEVLGLMPKVERELAQHPRARP